MKQFLLLSMCAALSMSAMAVTPDASATSRLVKPAKNIELRKTDGSLKRLKRVETFNNVINPVIKKNIRKAAATGAEGALMYESFENGGQLPEGWTIESKGSENLSDINHWMVTPIWNYSVPGPSQGDYYLRLFYSSDQQDEWLISPEIELDEAYELSFMAYINKGFFYVIDQEHLNYEAMEWINQEICNTFQILVKEEGGEWEVVRDMADEEMGTPYFDLAMAQPTSLELHKANLGKYAGKKVRIALRLSGHDSDLILLDEFRISLPEPEANMMAPYTGMFYGFSDEAGWQYQSRRTAIFPAYTPIGFNNMSYDDVKYSWLYEDPATGEMTTETFPDYLEVTYAPKYDAATGTLNNIVAVPSLCAEGKGWASVQNPWSEADVMQIGGEPRVKLSTGFTKTYGMLPFEQLTYDIGIYTVDCDEIGALSVPAFGYNSNTDEYWLHYSLGGEEPGEGDYAHLTAYYNMIYPAGSPLVVEGASALAYGFISDDAEFKCEIFAYENLFDEDGDLMGQVRIEKPLATAICKGSDVINRDPTINSALTIPFIFDNKVIIDDSAPAYCIRISGFRSDEVEFFAPAQQWEPNPNYLCLGWIEKEMSIYGRAGVNHHALGYYENEFGEMYCSFAINIAGYYPWLHSDEEEINLGNGTTAEVVLDSFNDGSKLEFECSPWIKASATGRYATKLAITAEPTDEANREGFVTVKTDGLSKTFKVTQQLSGINDAIGANGATVKATYTLDGIEVSGELPAGIYIDVYTDGTATKRVIK